MYLKLNNGAIEKYPYTIGELRRDNPQTSFPATISDTVLAEFDVYKVEKTDKPEVDFSKNVAEGTPELTDGVWKQTWVITNATYEQHLRRVLNARAEEYPPMADYLDGIVKGDQDQIQLYIDTCLAVKAKYPKPVSE